MTAASAGVARTFTAPQWVWPVNVSRYDRSPGLTADERLAIRALLKQDMHGRYRRDLSISEMPSFNRISHMALCVWEKLRTLTASDL